MSYILKVMNFFILEIFLKISDIFGFILNLFKIIKIYYLYYCADVEDDVAAYLRGSECRGHVTHA